MFPPVVSKISNAVCVSASAVARIGSAFFAIMANARRVMRAYLKTRASRMSTGVLSAAAGVSGSGITPDRPIFAQIVDLDT